MERLPPDVVLDILSRLPITTLVRSKSVCRSWRSIIQSSVLVDKHLSYMAENDPCIIFQSDVPTPDQYYLADFAACSEGNKSLKKIPVSAIDSTLVASSNGLLCLLCNSSVHICNPLTMDSVEIPNLLLRDHGISGVLGFGFSPTTKEYKVVEIIYRRKRLRLHPTPADTNPFQSQVRILTLGSSQWRSLGMAPYNFIQRLSQVEVNGRLHWISHPGNVVIYHRIISFDLTAEQFQEIPRADYMTLDRRYLDLVVLRGHLCVAATNASCGLDIWAMKEYNVKESWVKEFVIGGYLPEELRSSYRVPFFKSDFRAVCSFRNGKILLKITGKRFLLYDPVHEKFEDIIMFERTLNWDKMVVHVGGLVSI